MIPCRCGFPSAKTAFLTLFAVLSAALVLSGVRAQETPARARSAVRSGYTRPGNPPDEVKPDGAIRPVALEANYDGIGGTVYFAVLELTGAQGDAWGTGYRSFNEAFVPGKSVMGRGQSPPLDTRARYLYLYQVVNDRGVDRAASQIKPAGADPELHGQDIGSSSLNLIVDPRYLTSWGAFTDYGFAVDVVEKGGAAGTGPRFAALNEEGKFIRLAVSSTPAVTEALPAKAYRLRAPAYPLRNLLGIDRATVGLKETGVVQQLAKKQQDRNIKLAAYEQNLLKASAAANRPDYVEIVPLRNDFALSPALPGYDPTLLAYDTAPLGRDTSLLTGVYAGGRRPVARFRAEWQDKNVVRLGEHSTIYGFTTNLPPVDEPVRIRDPRLTALHIEEEEEIVAAPAASGVRAAWTGAHEEAPAAPDTVVRAASTEAEGIAPAGLAPGTAPTPAGGGAGFGAAPEAFSAMGPGLLGGAPFGPGIGGVGAGIPTTGFTRPAVAMGTPVVGGSSGGTGSGSGTTTPPTQSQSVVVNVNQSQSQKQQQQQQQQQQQTQTNTQGNVVPEPTAFLLGLFGLPLLFLFRLRKGTVGATV
jgi:hypothetical protein